MTRRNFSATHVAAGCAVQLHCRHEDGAVSLALTDELAYSPVTVYLTGSRDELLAFGRLVADIAAGLEVAT